MVLKRDEVYIPRKSFSTYDANESAIQFDKFSAYKCDSERRLVDTSTGEIFHVDNHVFDRSEWYFDRKGDFNPFRDDVTQQEYVTAILRGSDGLDLDALYEIAELEEFGPLKKPIKRSSFSQCLTQAVSTGKFEPHDRDGNLVVGVGHNKKNMTFHIVRHKVA